MNETKPCPFCGEIPRRLGDDWIICSNHDCPLSLTHIPTAKWNTRPLDEIWPVSRIFDLEAQLAAVPRWIKITDDPATWPPDDDDVLILTVRPDEHGDFDQLYMVDSAAEFREDAMDGFWDGKAAWCQFEFWKTKP